MIVDAFQRRSNAVTGCGKREAITEKTRQEGMRTCHPPVLAGPLR